MAERRENIQREGEGAGKVWGFVMSVVGKLRDNTRMEYTCLHYGNFTHETGLVISVTLTMERTAEGG